MKKLVIADTGQEYIKTDPPDDLDVLLLEANYNYRYRNFKAAHAAYKKLEELRPSGHIYYRLGVMYHDGLGVDMDAAQSKNYFSKALDLLDSQDLPESQCDLGYMYEQGYGVKRNKFKAVKYYKLAADCNYALAQYNFGVMLRNGHGIDENQELALKYFHLAASAGAPWAEYNLAGIYEVGVCGAKADAQLAQLYLQLAADNGDCRAQLHMAKVHETSNYNLKLALHYQHLAFTQKHELHNIKILKKLKKIYNGSRGSDYRSVANCKLAEEWPQSEYMINKDCLKGIFYVMYQMRNYSVPKELAPLVVKEVIKIWVTASEDPTLSHFEHLEE